MPGRLLVVPALALFCAGIQAQMPEGHNPRQQTVQDFTLRLTPDQKQMFEEAMSAFTGQKYTDALAGFKQLLAQLPGNPLLSKFAGEAGLNTGDAGFAAGTLRPIAEADPDDWQACALLARACAESGDADCRDRSMSHMLDLHNRGVTPPNMQQYPIERVSLGARTLLIRTSLVPWGPYNVYDLGQVMNSAGQIVLRITLESPDDDQASFAREHRNEAAQGVRSFSFDAYQETGPNSSGQRTQTHFTYGFAVGQPPYAEVRDEFIRIAEGKAKPLSSRTNLLVR